EIIVVDDASTDNTSDIVAALSHGDHRIQYMRHTTNRGAQASRNTGIRGAQGEWIAFLDSDDYWLPESLSIRLGIANQEGKRVIHSDCYIDRGQGVTTFGLTAESGWVRRHVLAAPGPLFPALLVGKEALDKIGYLDESIVSYQEWDTVIRLARYFEFGF